MNLLLTGFEPFGGFKENPTQLLAEHFDQKEISGVEITGAVIPLRFKEIKRQIIKWIDKCEPNFIVMTGQAPRTAITPERIAINYVGSSTPYNCGTKIEGSVLDPEGEDGIFSTLPIEPIVENLRNIGIPSYISLSAGSFGCNQIFYECQRYVRMKGLDVLSGFIHVPLLPKQVPSGKFCSMSLEMMIKAFETIFLTILAKS